MAKVPDIERLCERVWDLMYKTGVNYYPTNFEFKKDPVLDKEIRNSYGHQVIRIEMGAKLKAEYLGAVKKGRKRIASIKQNKQQS